MHIKCSHLPTSPCADVHFICSPVDLCIVQLGHGGRGALRVASEPILPRRRRRALRECALRRRLPRPALQRLQWLESGADTRAGRRALAGVRRGARAPERAPLRRWHEARPPGASFGTRKLCGSMLPISTLVAGESLRASIGIDNGIILSLISVLGFFSRSTSTEYLLFLCADER